MTDEAKFEAVARAYDAAEQEFMANERRTGNYATTRLPMKMAGARAAIAAGERYDAERGYTLAPLEPTETMWSGLARDIVMWTRFGGAHTARSLFEHLERVGREIPQWLRDEPELKSLDASPSKGTVAVIIYRAMLAAQEAE